MEGDGSPDPLLGEQVYVPYTDGVYPGVVTSFVAGAGGGRVWVEHSEEKEMFRVKRHLLYASHATAVTHWEQQKAVPAGKKAAKAKKKSNPKPDVDPPAEPAPKPANPDASLRLSRPLSPSPWRRMPQRTPRPNPQPNHLPKPMPRPPLEAKPRPRPPFGRTQQAPALRCRVA